jgi:hypothetical protein
VNELDRALLTGEEIVFATRKHWFAPVRDSVPAGLLIIGSFVLRWLAPSGGGSGILGSVGSALGGLLELAANIALLVGIGWIAFNVVAYLSAHFGVSNMRILRYEGIIQRRSSETLLQAVTDVRLLEPAIGRMLGYGDIAVFTASGEAGKDEFHTVAEAGKLRSAIQEQQTRAKTGGGPAVDAPPAPAPSAPVAPAPPVASASTEAAATLADLAAMRDQGLITPEEFEAKKTEILGRI